MTENTGVGDEAPGAASLQRQLLTRAGVAASFIVVMLGGLAVYDHLNRPAAPPPAAVSPEAPGPAAQEVAAGAAAAPIENKAEEVDARRAAPSEPELNSAPQLAPPGQRQADAPAPRSGTPHLVLGGEPDASPSHPPRPGAALAGPKPAPPEASAAGKGYLVQLGVFASLENAETLRARVEALGIPAHLESRVVVGPFPDQAAARAAQARLRGAGQEAGLLVPPRR